MNDGQLRDTLIAAGKVLAAAGQGDFTRGHISVRLPDDPGRFLMKPHSVGLDELTRDNILTIGLDGEVVAGTARRHSEVYIHSEILKARPDINSVIHSHPLYAVALSATGQALRPVSQPGALFFEATGVYGESMALIRDAAMGAGVAKALGPGRAVFMKNHGVAVAAASIEEAVISALMLENAAQIQMLAMAAGGLAPEFSRADVEKLKDQLSKPEQFKINFDYLARKIADGQRRI